jgi:tetratricopeptide (TPR) repeat protein
VVPAEAIPDSGTGSDAGKGGSTTAEVMPDSGQPPDAGKGPESASAQAEPPASPDAGAAPGARPAPQVVHDFDFYVAQGDRLRERDRYEAAMAMYAKAIELKPDRAEPVTGRGLALLDLGKPPQAEASFQKALQLNPRYAVAIMGLAETYRTLGRNADAIEYYKKYLDVLPNGPEASAAKNALERLKE